MKFLNRLMLFAVLPAMTISFASCDEDESSTEEGSFSNAATSTLSSLSDNQCSIDGTVYNLYISAHVSDGSDSEQAMCHFNMQVVDSEGTRVSAGSLMEIYGYGDMSYSLLGKTISLVKPSLGEEEYFTIGLYNQEQENGYIGLDAFGGEIYSRYGEKELEGSSCFKDGAIKCTASSNAFSVVMYGVLEDGGVIAIKGNCTPQN